MLINVLDPIYQVSKDFAPDKESTWSYPKEQDGWVIAHNALRQEISEIKQALAALRRRGGITKEWEIKALQDAVNAHLIHIHAHHSNEDNKMTPFITTRFKYPAKLTEDHDGIIQQLARLESLVKALKVNDSVNALLTAFIDYEEDLLPHLAEEEEIGLPLMRAYFTPKEIAVAVMEIVKHSPKLETGSLVQSCGVDYWKKTFMVQEGIPFFVWHIDFYWKHQDFLKAFTYNIQALVDGKERKKRSRMLL